MWGDGEDREDVEGRGSEAKFNGYVSSEAIGEVRGCFD